VKRLIAISFFVLAAREFTRRWKKKQRYPDLSILMLTVYDDNERIFDALCAGACGYL
jgi:DNA-binding NarL/FixJ family response regulator